MNAIPQNKRPAKNPPKNVPAMMPSVRALLLSEGASLEGAVGAAATAWNAGAAILGAAVAR